MRPLLKRIQQWKTIGKGIDWVHLKSKQGWISSIALLARGYLGALHIIWRCNASSRKHRPGVALFFKTLGLSKNISFENTAERMRSGSRLRVARGKMFSMQGARRRVHLQWQQSKRQIPRRTTGSGNGQQGEQVCVCELKWASWGLGLGVCPLENTFTRRELFRKHAKDQSRRKLLYNGRPLLKEKCL